MRSDDLRIDVSDVTGIAGAAVGLTLHLPDAIAPGAPLELLFCVHGGGYTRAYWHPPFSAQFPGYSFAEHMTALGYAVAAIDMLGMGASSQPEPETLLSRMNIAAAHHAVVTRLREGLADGRFADAARVIVSGIGHSMGGMMVTTQAAAHASFDRLAVWGWANMPMVLGDVDPREMAAAIVPGYLPSPRLALRAFFYEPDVPIALIEADEAIGSTSPACMGRDALTPGVTHDAAASIAIPVFVLQSEVDTSSDPHAEPAFFKASPDVTLMVMPATTHCQNFATRRHALWDRFDGWIRSLPA